MHHDSAASGDEREQVRQTTIGARGRRGEEAAAVVMVVPSATEEVRNVATARRQESTARSRAKCCTSSGKYAVTGSVNEALRQRRHAFNQRLPLRNDARQLIRRQ